MTARSRSSVSFATLLAPIILPNIQRPMPPKLKCEGFDFEMSPPYIMPSILPKKVLPVLMLFRIARRPQNVKNIVTFMPMAAAPVAMMNAPNNLSMSPLMTTSVIFFLRGAGSGSAITCATAAWAAITSGAIITSLLIVFPVLLVGCGYDYGDAPRWFLRCAIPRARRCGRAPRRSPA